MGDGIRPYQPDDLIRLRGICVLTGAARRARHPGRSGRLTA